MDQRPDPNRIRCPHCMGFLDGVLLKELPPHKWEYDGQVVAMGRTIVNRVLRHSAVGECHVHGVVVTKA